MTGAKAAVLTSAQQCVRVEIEREGAFQPFVISALTVLEWPYPVSSRKLCKQSSKFCAGAYTARRYSLWQSRQAVLNAQLTGPTGASNSQLDTETAAADAIAALGRFDILTSAGFVQGWTGL